MNPVLYWNAVLLEASRRDFTRGFTGGQQPGPIRTAYAMAMVHLAIHDAVAFKQKPGAAYLNKKGFAHGITAPLTGDLEDIIAGAAVTALKRLYPRFEQQFDDALEAVGAAAFAEGAQVADALFLERQGDGADHMLMGAQPAMAAYGEHRADPYAPAQMQLGPAWGNVRRFVGGTHQPLDPPPGASTASGTYLADPHYRADYDEVRDLGAVSRGGRTAEQQRIGVYWGYDGANNLGVPPRLYNQVARAIVLARDPALSLRRQAELFAAVNVALADAGIDCWHYKYLHKLWRPVVGIRAEAAPEGDPFWAPLGMPQTNAARATLTPPFPAYPSGHATFCAAMMQTLRLGLKTAPGALTVHDVLDVEGGTSAPIAAEQFHLVSDELDSIALDPDGSVRQRVEQRFRNFAEAVWENSVSRVYLGVHWRFDGLPRDAGDRIGGVPLGLSVGEEVHGFFDAAPSLGGSG
ncbi:hypothetical protein KZ813_15695 [Sphingomonas sp. RHCKR7]|uniref:vanadium-dependent haloperoxidase n=1 Tax=Sphingomonas folli TaxID=2862497 RepID=UPI001CA55110|nr:vanadium-dependent haloperoxidase [Sphingomonas folli]MBW6528284.1 hypothetical protein [Sphingomonas folli]